MNKSIKPTHGVSPSYAFCSEQGYVSESVQIEGIEGGHSDMALFVEDRHMRGKPLRVTRADRPPGPQKGERIMNLRHPEHVGSLAIYSTVSYGIVPETREQYTFLVADQDTKSSIVELVTFIHTATGHQTAPYQPPVDVRTDLV